MLVLRMESTVRVLFQSCVSLKMYQRSLMRTSNNSGWFSSSILKDRVQSILFVHFHLELVYLVTAFVPSDTACLASSPGRSRRTAVWISRDVIVERLL